MEHKRPTFKKADRDDFFHQLRREVTEKVLTNRRLHRQNIHKAFLLLFLYFAFYSCILLFGNDTQLLFLFYMLTGFAMITLFINSFHDAVHGALFSKPRYNAWFSNILTLFGSNTWLWTKRHIALHHAYPNVQEWDIDIKQSDIVRIFPNSPWAAFHKYQHIYMWLIYPLYSLNWILIRDFKDFFSNGDNYIKRITRIPKIEIVKLFLAKAFNLLYLLLLPMLLLEQPWYLILAGWLFMHVCGSTLGVIALISTHVDENAQFPDATKGQIPTTWAQHQLMVTKDFSTDSRVANFLFGGFTHHVAHHLFPGVAHTYYPHITPLIRQYASRHNLPYTCYPFHHAVRSHFRMLRNNGKVNLMSTGDL